MKFFSEPMYIVENLKTGEIVYKYTSQEASLAVSGFIALSPKTYHIELRDELKGTVLEYKSNNRRA